MSLVLEELLEAFYQEAHIMIHCHLSFCEKIDKMKNEIGKDIEKTMLARQNAKDILEKIKKEITNG